LTPIEIEIEFKREFGMTISQAYKVLDNFKKANEEKFQDSYNKALSEDELKNLPF